MEIFKHIEFIEKFNKGVRSHNQYNSRPTKVNMTPDNIKEFNSIYLHFKRSNLNMLDRTPRGTIKKNRNNKYAWDYRQSSLGAIITVIMCGKIYCYKIGVFKKDSDGNRPDIAFSKFNQACLDNGINLDNYKIDNGDEVKKTIRKPLIYMKYHMSELDKPLNNVHHLDFHSSYPAGLCNTHPEFRKVIEPMYEQRKQFPHYKDILNFTIGYMQSSKGHLRAEWAHLSKDAIDDNIYRVLSTSMELQSNGREIIGYNTDGIWYKGEIYHNENEGNKLGQWSNDYINCTFRSKSDGAYEFIDGDNKYHPVVRGLIGYDSIKDRDDWEWGDIYKGESIKFKFDDKVGIIYEV